MFFQYFEKFIGGKGRGPEAPRGSLSATELVKNFLTENLHLKKILPIIQGILYKLVVLHFDNKISRTTIKSLIFHIKIHLEMTQTQASDEN